MRASHQYYPEVVVKPQTIGFKCLHHALRHLWTSYQWGKKQKKEKVVWSPKWSSNKLWSCLSQWFIRKIVTLRQMQHELLKKSKSESIKLRKDCKRLRDSKFNFALNPDRKFWCDYKLTKNNWDKGWLSDYQDFNLNFRSLCRIPMRASKLQAI